MQTITWDDFIKIELRVGRIVSAVPFPEAKKPAYMLQVDFGRDIGIKKSSAQITDLYKPKDFSGKAGCRRRKFPKQANRSVDVRMPGHAIS
mgnify:FL=1